MSLLEAAELTDANRNRKPRVDLLVVAAVEAVLLHLDLQSVTVDVARQRRVQNRRPREPAPPVCVLTGILSRTGILRGCIAWHICGCARTFMCTTGYRLQRTVQYPARIRDILYHRA